MKKYILGLLVVGFIYSLSFIPQVKAVVSSLAIYPSATVATTTRTYMTPGTATTTVALYETYNNNESDESNSLYVLFTASTSAATLNWKYQFSNSGNDWFEEDISMIPSAGVPIAQVDHASTTITHVWTPGSTVASTSMKVIKLPSVDARYKRVIFSIPIGSTNGAIWTQSANKKTNN